MQPEISDPPTSEDHLLIDIHDLCKTLHDFKQEFEDLRDDLRARLTALTDMQELQYREITAKIAEWEKIAHPLVRLREAGKLRNLGRGRHAVPEDQVNTDG